MTWKLQRDWIWYAAIIATLIAMGLLGQCAHGQTFTNVTYTQKYGEPNAPQNTHTLLLNGASNRWYENCTFDSDGIKLDNCSSFTFNNCTIKNARRTSGNHQAVFLASCKDITIKNLKVINCTAVGQIYGGNNLTWTGGQFGGSNVGEGCEYGLKASIGGVKNWRIDGIKMKRMRAMGLEFQFDDQNTDGIYVGNCSYDEAERWNNDDQNNGPRMAFSVPTPYAKNVVIENNYASGLCWLIDASGQRQSSPGWLGVRIGIECGGQGTVVRNNWIGPKNKAIHDAGSVVPGSANCIIGPNLIEASNEPFNMQGGGAAGSNKFGQNDANVLLTGSGGWSLVGLTPPGSTTPPPVIIPPTTLPSLPKLTHTLDIYDNGSFKVRP